MKQQMSSTLQQLEGNGSKPDLVAGALLQAATAKNPEVRYLAGKDVELWVEQQENIRFSICRNEETGHELRQ